MSTFNFFYNTRWKRKVLFFVSHFCPSLPNRQWKWGASENMHHHRPGSHLHLESFIILITTIIKKRITTLLWGGWNVASFRIASNGNTSADHFLINRTFWLQWSHNTVMLLKCLHADLQSNNNKKKMKNDEYDGDSTFSTKQMSGGLDCVSWS